jgi:hypothetical protein
MVSNLSFRGPAKMIDSDDGLLIGLEAELVSDGHKHGRQLIELPTFASRQPEQVPLWAQRNLLRL